MSIARLRPVETFKTCAFSLGDCALASGQKCTYYVNPEKAIFKGEGVNF